MKKNVALWLSLLSLFSFLLLSKYEDRPFLRNLDFAVTTKIQDKIDKTSHLRMQRFVDNTMEGATFFASPGFTSIVVIMLTGWTLYDWKKKRFNFRALVILVAFVVIVLVELYGKSVVAHPSPPFSMIKHTTSVFPANYINEQFSYPSGHAARAVFLAIILFSVVSRRSSVFKNNKKKLLIVAGLVGYVLLVAASRIYLGHHWFSDVLGGLLLGSGLGGASYWIAVR